MPAAVMDAPRTQSAVVAAPGLVAVMAMTRSPGAGAVAARAYALLALPPWWCRFPRFVLPLSVYVVRLSPGLSFICAYSGFFGAISRRFLIL